MRNTKVVMKYSGKYYSMQEGKLKCVAVRNKCECSLYKGPRVCKLVNACRGFRLTFAVPDGAVWRGT